MRRPLRLSIALCALTAACSTMAARDLLLEVPSPDREGDGRVVRIEKERLPLLGDEEVRPCQSLDVSEAGVAWMMGRIVRRYFKDPQTFVPPGSEDEPESLAERAVTFLLVDEPVVKNTSATYQPPLDESAHPASMSRRKAVFSPEEIDTVAAPLASALADLRDGEQLRLQINAVEGRETDSWSSDRVPDLTDVTIRCDPPGDGLLDPRTQARIVWEFDQVDGIRFRGKDEHRATYWVRRGDEREDYDFLVVFPKPPENPVYWEAEFPAG